MVSKTTWERNEIQFPRLLAEIYATQDLGKLDIPALCESMDLGPADIAEIFERAEVEWERIKARTVASEYRG